jgi:hypothetical protein
VRGDNCGMQENKLQRLRRFVLRVEFIPYVLFTVIGLSVLIVVGGIVAGALRNGSLMPPPSSLLRYQCEAPGQSFTLEYRHGADRVVLRTANGLLEGSVNQGQLDWKAFADDRSVLGFVPPGVLGETPSGDITLQGRDMPQARCVRQQP